MGEGIEFRIGCRSVPFSCQRLYQEGAGSRGNRVYNGLFKKMSWEGARRGPFWPNEDALWQCPGGCELTCSCEPSEKWLHISLPVLRRWSLRVAEPFPNVICSDGCFLVGTDWLVVPFSLPAFENFSLNREWVVTVLLQVQTTQQGWQKLFFGQLQVSIFKRVDGLSLDITESTFLLLVSGRVNNFPKTRCTPVWHFPFGLSSWEVTGENIGSLPAIRLWKDKAACSVWPFGLAFLLLNPDPWRKKETHVPELACREGLSCCPALHMCGWRHPAPGGERSCSGSHTAPLFSFGLWAPGSTGRVRLCRALCVWGTG